MADGPDGEAGPGSANRRRAAAVRPTEADAPGDGPAGHHGHVPAARFRGHPPAQQPAAGATAPAWRARQWRAAARLDPDGSGRQGPAPALPPADPTLAGDRVRRTRSSSASSMGTRSGRSRPSSRPTSTGSPGRSRATPTWWPQRGSSSVIWIAGGSSGGSARPQSGRTAPRDTRPPTAEWPGKRDRPPIPEGDTFAKEDQMTAAVPTVHQA